MIKRIILLVGLLFATQVNAELITELPSLSSLAGKWVIVSYWAPWCSACAEETPGLNRIYENGESNVVIYGVNYDQPGPDETNAAIQKMEIRFPVLLQDPRLAWNLGSVTLLPTTFIITPKGRVAIKLLGAHDETSILTTLHALQKDNY